MTEPPSRLRRFLRTALRFLVVAGLAGGGWYAYTTWKKTNEKPPRYETEPAVIATLSERVTATGTLQALVTVQVGSQVSGRIYKLHADFNSKVAEGQLLAEIDPSLLKAQLAQARAAVANGEASLERARARGKEAERSLARIKRLFDKQLVSEQERDTALATREATGADMRAAQAAITQARAQLDLAKANLAYTKIHAPISGVVLARQVDIGQTVAASFQSPTLFSIAQDLERMQVHANVDEADVGRLREGMDATFQVDAFQGETFKGRVSQVRYNPVTVQNVVTYDAVVDCENPGARLRPGMTATVTFEVTRRENVLAVPNAALRFKPPEPDGANSGDMATGKRTHAPEGKAGAARAGKSEGDTPTADMARQAPQGPTVFVLRDGQPEAIRVTIGTTDGKLTEVTAVLSGELAADTAVVVRRIEGSKPGGSAPGGGSPLGPGGRGSPRRMF